MRKLHRLPDVAAALNVSVRTLENPRSSVRRQLESAGAVVRVGQRAIRITDEGLEAIIIGTGREKRAP